MRNDFCVRIGGAAGDGVSSTGEILARTCSRSGLHVYGLNSYQSAIRGGHVWFQVRGSSNKVTSQGDNLDVLIALNSETGEIHSPLISSGGVVIYDKDKVKFSPNLIPSSAKALPMPLSDTSRKFDKNPIMQNTVALGATLFLLGLDFNVFTGVLTDTFGKKKQAVVDANVKAAQAGYDYAKANFSPLQVRANPPANPRPKMLMTGNQAIALGAVMAGCKFYAAYPMTPASGILHWMAAHAASARVVVKQAEDELAVINMGIGAAHAGVRAMVGTSGGGFSLMVEALGLAGMTETPIVIVDSQRAGPSTGLPTKTEQGDLNMMTGASQGDFPRIVLAPLTVEDAYYAAIEAFNLAERFQCPVIIASDLLLSEHIESVDELSSKVVIDRGELISSASEPYLRYKVTETGISPRAIPGTNGTIYVAASDEHEESGAVISDVLSGIPVYVKEREKQMIKRMKKMDLARNELAAPKLYGVQDADLTLVCWGSTFGVALEAAEMLTASGIKTNVYPIRNVMPFKSDAIETMLKSARNLLIVECNYSGQMARMIRAETGFEVPHRFLKFDGEPLYPYEIVQNAKKVLTR
ncbi:MAG TPA: 2-oxoacid:acceptor oxidoreductase subunit alpha [Nitrososphaerales archaeon]|nr:2-oxoacid:acceptor oxidoreductase subunit alpha [Nitrososphaerales archaeon]